jgi:hypothetical protein
MSSAATPVKNIPGIAKAIPGSDENHSSSRRNHCSPSARNPVRLHPGIVFAITPESLFALPRNPQGWKRNSGYQVKARIDPDQKIWYGAMKIPLSAIDRRAAAGNELRMNFYGDPEPSKGRRPAQHPDAAFLATHLLPNNQSRSRIIRKVEDAVRYSKMNMVVHDWPSRIESH